VDLLAFEGFRSFADAMLARLAAALIVSAVLVVPALAQLQFGQPPNRPIRLEGYWERTRADREVIGEIMISAPGRAPRRFGVAALQAYQPEEEGMQVLRFTSDHPATLLARGDAVDRLWEVKKDEKLRAFGTYAAGSGLFVVGSVDVVDASGGRR
jgi:hypothetical protein